MKNNKNYSIKLTVIKLAEEIVRFDSEVLSKIHKVLPEDMLVLKKVVRCREDLFDLEEQLRGCEIVEFATGNPGGEI